MTAAAKELTNSANFSSGGANRSFTDPDHTARVFLEALQRGEVPPEVARIEVPLAVSRVLEGPSADFKIGRIYEAAVSEAFDEIVKKKTTENG